MYRSVFNLTFWFVQKPATNEQKVLPVPAAPFTITIESLEGRAVKYEVK